MINRINEFRGEIRIEVKLCLILRKVIIYDNSWPFFGML